MQVLARTVLNKRHTKGITVLPMVLSLLLLLSVPLTELAHNHTDHGECDVCICLNKFNDQIKPENELFQVFFNPPHIFTTLTDSVSHVSHSDLVAIRGPPSKFKKY